MRLAYPALLTLLVASTIPSVGSAQIVIPESPHYDARLDRAVPVATVSFVGDIVELGGARVVRDSSGEFVLGAATLDFSDPIHARVLFTFRNATDTVVALHDVLLHEVEVASRPGENDVSVACALAPLADYSGQKELKPGATVTVQMPIAPRCAKLGETKAFLVFVGRPLPHPDSATPDGPEWKEVGQRYAALFRRAFEQLRAQSQP